MLFKGRVIVRINSERLKNIKIIRSIVAMWVISLITTIIIGIVGYINTSQMYITTNNMYNNVIPKLKDWGDVNGNMGVLRNTLTKIIDRPFDEQNEKTMKELDKDIRDIIAKNVQTYQSDKKEAELVAEMKKAYEHYYSFIPGIIEQRKNEIVPDKQITNIDMGAYGNDLAQKNIALIDYQKQLAKEQDERAKSLYQHSMTSFAVIFGISLFFLTVISIFVIFIIKYSIKDFSDSLQILSSGDFTVKFNTELTNEFGLMYKELDKTIKAISSIFTIIKNDSTCLTEETMSLYLISKEMHSSVEGVSDSIQDVATGSTKQAQELISISSTLKFFGETLEEITQSIDQVDKDAKKINNKAHVSGEQLTELVEAINEIASTYDDARIKIHDLTSSVKKITKITNQIKNIADQTSLNALNASIEAASAGDS
jgi:methyl-accepting chemotaxis protein